MSYNDHLKTGFALGLIFLSLCLYCTSGSHWKYCNQNTRKKNFVLHLQNREFRQKYIWKSRNIKCIGIKVLNSPARSELESSIVCPGPVSKEPWRPLASKQAKKENKVNSSHAFSSTHQKNTKKQHDFVNRLSAHQRPQKVSVNGLD